MRNKGDLIHWITQPEGESYTRLRHGKLERMRKEYEQ